jgi:mRNA interferase RelE/StbE
MSKHATQRPDSRDGQGTAPPPDSAAGGANWRLEYSINARKQLRKLDVPQRTIILAWMDKNIDGCGNPRIHGSGLTANHSGEWRYRIGDYRILCEIQDAKLIVLALNIKHRSRAYS